MENRIIRANGEIVIYNPRNGKDYELDELQSIVGGYIEIIRLDDEWLMIINDEGKLYQMPLNQLATYIAKEKKAISSTDFVVGDVLVCHKEFID